jgi:predicted permease
VLTSHLRQDLRYSLRQFRRGPLFAAIAAASLGIGVAVAVVAFSVVNSLIFKPLAVEDPDRLVRIFTSPPMPGDGYFGSSYDDVKDYEATGAFTGVVAQWDLFTEISADGHFPDRALVAWVSPDFFEVVGVRLRAGRTFTRNGEQSEIIISEQYARRISSSGESVIGTTIRMHKVPFTVIGIAPESFRGLSIPGTSAWLPAPARSALYGRIGTPSGERGDRWWSMAARLAPGVTREGAASRLNRVAQSLAAQYPAAWRDHAQTPLHVSVLTTRETILRASGTNLPELLLILAVLVGVVLILACTNVAGLLLARAVTRRHEIAVRLTLGASRRRLILQLFTEAVLLSLAGGVIGFLAALSAIHAVGGSPILQGFRLQPDWRVFAATSVLCVGCALVFGITPIAQSLRADVKSGLGGYGMATERGDVRARLIALQVCLAFLLIVIGVSASRGMRSQLETTAGFDIDGLLIVDLGDGRQDPADRRAVIENTLALMRSIPGVTHATFAQRVPLEGGPGSGAAVATSRGLVQSGAELVDAEYFPTVGLRLLEGHLPRRDERPQGLTPIVITRALTNAIGRDVTGMTLTLADGRQVVVTGVVEDVRHNTMDTGREPYMYELRPEVTGQENHAFIVARTAPGAGSEVIGEFSRQIRSRYPALAPPPITALRARLERELAPQRYIGRAMLIIGGIELLLAALGLYSLLLYGALARTREIGLRMALGALPSRASMTVMKDGLRFVFVGAMLGATFAVPAAFFAAMRFIGARAADPVPFLAAAIAILSATAAAAAVPARKASKIQPMEALKYD